MPRRYNATRTDLDNLLCLCYECHAYWTKHPNEFTDYVIGVLGKAKYKQLKRKSERVTKMDWQDEYKRLKVIHTQIKDYLK